MSALAAAPIASRPAGPWRGLPADASSRVKFGIRAKITAGFGGIVLITATVGLFNLYTLAQVGTLSDTIYEDRVIPMRDLSQVRANVAESDTQMLRAIIDSSGVSVASAQGAVEKNSAEAERLIANYEQLIVVEDERRALGTFRADWTQYQDASRVVLGALTSGDRSSALRLYSERATPLVSRLNADLAYLITVNVRSARATDDETDAANRRSLMITIPLLLLTVVLSSVIGLVLSGRIASTAQDVTSAARALARGELNRGVDAHSNDELGSMADALREMVTYQRQMAIVADAIANGDLSQDVEPQSQDDVLGLAFQRMSSTLRRTATVADAIAHGDLTQDVQPQSGEDVLGLAFQRMSMNLRQMVAELSAASQQLASAGNEILAAVAQQSSGATEQSAAIAQTTATVDEVKASADQASQAASNVAESAEQTNRVAGEGVASVQEATNGMGDIHQKVQVIAENIQALSEQSQQIGDIITSVNDLADQSNLLALNAAIEASRAGEQGKGFAVVAAEIRNLAEQSKAATEQVRTILSDIQRATNATVMATEQGTRGVDAGSQAIDHVGQTIGELAEAIQQTAESAHQIAGSVRQHSIGMEQIAMAMSNINQATVQNLAATTDTEKAARNLTEVAHRINGLVAQYHV